MSYSFDDRIDDEEEILSDFTKVLRSITWGIIFCPKCGAKNSFREGAPGIELNYFCTNCSARLNDYWKGYENGQKTLINCENCQQLTFNLMIYCIHCGAKQRKIAEKVSKQLSKTLGPRLNNISDIDIPKIDSKKNPGLSSTLECCVCISDCSDCSDCCTCCSCFIPSFLLFFLRLLIYPLKIIKQRLVK